MFSLFLLLNFDDFGVSGALLGNPEKRRFFDRKLRRSRQERGWAASDSTEAFWEMQLNSRIVIGLWRVFKL